MADVNARNLPAGAFQALNPTPEFVCLWSSILRSVCEPRTHVQCVRGEHPAIILGGAYISGVEKDVSACQRLLKPDFAWPPQTGSPDSQIRWRRTASPGQLMTNSSASSTFTQTAQVVRPSNRLPQQPTH